MSGHVEHFGNPIVLGGSVGYYPSFISREQADALFAALQKLKWSQYGYRGAGADAPLCAWMGLSHTSPDSTNAVVASEWTPEAKQIKVLIEERTGCDFDSLALNLYRDHRDCVSPRSVDTRLRRFPIASLSLGAERRLRWENIQDASTTMQLLEHGSLLLMPPSFQRDNRHELPKQEKPCGPRINLTFRKLAP